MSDLSRLHYRYNRFATLGDNIQLFWTLTSSSNNVDNINSIHNNTKSNTNDGNIDTITIAVAYLLPNDQLHETIHSEEQNSIIHQSSYWLGFGLSDQGGMIGADMFIYNRIGHVSTITSDTHKNNNEHRLLDAHGIAYSYPIIDKCGQDWKFVNASIIVPSEDDEDNEEVWHIIEVTRSLQSNDINEDLPFINDSSTIMNPTHVLAAWGQINLQGSEEENDGRLLNTEETKDVEFLDLTSVLTPHGPSSRVSSTVRFFAKQEEESVSNDVTDNEYNPNLHDMPFIDLVPNEKFQIPGEETTYKNFCFNLADYPELMNTLSEHDQVHITGFHDIIDEGSLVHHMDLHGTTNDILGRDKRLCRVYMDLVHPWEAGSPTSFELPSEAGIPLGGSDGYKAFRVEVHYHNPRRRSGLFDQSGVRIYYSINKRPNVAGLMLLGDYMLKLRGSYTVPPLARTNSTTMNNVGGMRHSFYCPPSCFSKSRIGSSGSNVTVFREVLHMHKSGKRMSNVQLDSNGTIIRASEANYFDFSRGAGYASRVDMPYQINEGDSFVTSCYFATRNVLWGSGSDQEMCQSFLWYWPKESYSLTCGYYDTAAVVMTKEGSSDDDPTSSLDSIGCEMRYDRAGVAVATDLDRLKSSEEHCEVAVNSERSINRFDELVSNVQKWPSLLRLVNTWKSSNKKTEPRNSTIFKPENVRAQDASSTTSTLNENCHLCPNGEPPTRPDVIVKGTSWTCDELDAAIPIMYTEPELLFFSKSDVPPCEKYRASFGEICGCPTDSESALMTNNIVRVTGVLLLISLIMVYWRRRRS